MRGARSESVADLQQNLPKKARRPTSPLIGESHHVTVSLRCGAISDPRIGQLVALLEHVAAAASALYGIADGVAESHLGDFVRKV